MDLRHTRDLIAQWPVRRRAAAAYRDFVRVGSASALRHLLNLLRNNNLAVDVSQLEVRERLFEMDWAGGQDPIEPADRDLAFRALDEFLFDPAFPKNTGEWTSWIRMSRAAARKLPVTEPQFARGLLLGKKEGMCAHLAKEDSEYLLSCYLRCYGEILDKAQAEDRQLVLPILLEFAAIAQALGPSAYSSTTLQRWAQNAQRKPRALACFTREQAWNAPIRGIGSPNGISVTPYRDGTHETPVRIAYAGTTADRTLNAQVFAGLFSAALASDSNRSFVTPVGGLLQLEAGGTFHYDEYAVYRGSIEPLGPIEPESGVAPIGMPASDAFQLVNELFQRFKACTGLVSVMHWSVQDADEVEQRVRAAFGSEGEGSRLCSKPAHSEGNSVIHVMPLLHRVPIGAVEPVRIPVPYSILNPALALKLTRAARQAYMAQLIANCRRREAMASQTYQEQDKYVKQWEVLTREAKDARCRAHPTIYIGERYDLELGIVVRVDPPESVPLAEFENVSRPRFRDYCKEWSEKFAALRETLERLNGSDGPADTLTFKFLVDAAIRQSPVLIAGEDFQRDYSTWIRHTTAPVWAAIEDWAKRRGYPIEMLAGDNILFSSEWNEAERMVWILPHVMIDLHDFEIVIDGPGGMMYSLLGNRSNSIRQKIVTSPEHGVTDPASLREKFGAWVHTRLQPLSTRAQSEQDLRRQVLSDKRFSGLVYLEQGKRLLYKREWDRSIAALAQARTSDLAPVYFWGAVAHQCRFLNQNRLEPPTAANIGELEKVELLVRRAIQLLVDSTSAPLPTVVAPSLWQQPLEVGIPRPGRRPEVAPPVAAIDPKAQVYWNQLRSRDPRYIQELTKPGVTIRDLEAASLNITPSETKKLAAALHTLMALDFLALAERMKVGAKSLPFSGLPAHELRGELENILRNARTMPVEDPPAMEHIEELGGLLSHSRFI